MTAPGPRDRSVWLLFADWCAARNLPAMPATPLVLAQFLGDNPAAAGTQRRRVGAINAAHRRAGCRPPGHLETVRMLLDTRRAGMRRARSVAVAHAIGRMPETGWPTALFASRDALLLALWAAGMPYSGISALRIGDISGDGDQLTAACSDGDVFTTPHELASPELSPGALWRYWRDIRAIQHGTPSPRRVAVYLSGNRRRRVPPAPPDLPVFTPVDRWGDIAVPAEPLSAAGVSGIISAHVRGSAPAHASRTQPRRDLEPKPTQPLRPVGPALLDSGTVTRGIAARHRAARDLAAADELLDDVSRRADQLLADLLQLLDEGDTPTVT